MRFIAVIVRYGTAASLSLSMCCNTADPRGADGLRDLQGQRVAVRARGQREGGGALRALRGVPRQEARLPALPADHRPCRQAVHTEEPGLGHARGVQHNSYLINLIDSLKGPRSA